MASYTTVAKVKQRLPFEYDSDASDKLEQDGWIVGGTFDETGFIQGFIDSATTFINDSLGGGPFQAHGVLDTICKAVATYEIEAYLKAAQSERTVSITIYTDYQSALKLLQKCIDGTIPVSVTDTEAEIIGLIEPDGGGDPVAIETMEEDLFSRGEDLTGRYGTEDED